MKNAMILMAMGLAACAPVRYVAVPVAPELPVTPVLQACADHAASAQKKAFGEEFRLLQLDTAGLVLTAPEARVGSQDVGAVYDGMGSWYGAQEFRRVKFHCLISTRGQVVYSFVRGE